jgi:hypothetical protein
MKGLRLQSKSGQILWDSAWIAGVDYYDDEDEDDENEADENKADENEADEAEGDDSQENKENESLYDKSDPNEIFDDDPDANEPIQHASDVEDEEEQAEQEPMESDSGDDEEEEQQQSTQGLRQLTRGSVKPQSYVPSFTGKLYSQATTQPEMEYTMQEANVGESRVLG